MSGFFPIYFPFLQLYKMILDTIFLEVQTVLKSINFVFFRDNITPEALHRADLI